MQTLKTFWHNITAGAERVTLWLRGTASALAGALVQWAMLKPDELTANWTVHDWVKHAAPVVVLFLVGLIAHGEKNPAPQVTP